MPRVRPDVAIVSHDTDDYLLNLLRSLEPLVAASRIGDVFVWDNASTDRTKPMLAAYGRSRPWLHVHACATNVHHGPALDALLRGSCRADWVLVLDVDTEIVRDFSDALAVAIRHDATFVGQIHPQMPHLYAYLAHLLVYRPSYLDLPPFCHDGAPGLHYFRAIQAEQRPYVRFRWCDYVHHFGQGALRRVVDRGDRCNEFYGFAAREQARRPSPPARVERERELRRALDRFLQESAHEMPTVDAAAAPAIGGRDVPPSIGRRRARQHAARWLNTAREYLRSPRATRAWFEAQRLGIVQMPAEALRLHRLVEQLRPERVLEIGTLHGGSLLLWARAAAARATLVSLDLPPWESDDPAEPAKRRTVEHLGSPMQRVHALRGDSHDAAMRERARDCLNGAIDFLFLDGDHSYDGVKQDFADYAPLVRTGGLVALHDIRPHSRGWGGEVPRFWNEIRAWYRHAEIVADRSQDGFGIGVLWL